MFDEYNKGVGLGFRSFREKLSININDKGQEDLKKQKKCFKVRNENLTATFLASQCKLPLQNPFLVNTLKKEIYG